MDFISVYFNIFGNYFIISSINRYVTIHLKIVIPKECPKKIALSQDVLWNFLIISPLNRLVNKLLKTIFPKFILKKMSQKNFIVPK